MGRWDGHSARSAHQGTDGPAAGGGGTESLGVLTSAHCPDAQGAQPATKKEPLCATPRHGAGAGDGSRDDTLQGQGAEGNQSRGQPEEAKVTRPQGEGPGHGVTLRQAPAVWRCLLHGLAVWPGLPLKGHHTC